MNRKKNFPLWLVILLDILLIGVCLLTFAFFHHVKDAMFESHTPLPDINRPTLSPSGSDKHLVHEWMFKEKVPAGCTTEGYTVYVCSCGEEKKEERTEPLGHGDPIVKNKVDATFEHPGYTGDEYCSRCGELLKAGQETPALQHENTVLINVVEATCEHEGYSGDVFCNDCQKIVAKGSVTPKTDHHYLEGEVVPPTCIAQGYTVYRCKDCGTERQGDYTEKGSHVKGSGGKCTVCGEYLVDISGQFGTNGAGMFLDDDSVVRLTDDAEIRKYAKDNYIILPKDDAAFAESEKYISLYRSHDIYLAVREINGKNGTSYTALRYYIYDIYIRNIENFYTVTKKDTLENQVAYAEKNMGAGVVTAINGDYYNLGHCKVAIRNGQVVNNKTGETVNRDVATLYYDGRLSTYTPENYNFDTIMAGNPYQIWNFGPALIDENGKAIKKYDTNNYDGIIDSKDPRSAIGYYAPGHYCFVGVVGRIKNVSYGLTMAGLANVLERLGCVAGYNLDGGASSQSYNVDEVLYHSSGHRNVPDILLIGEVKRKDEEGS